MILLTGGNGLIGSFIAQKLLNENIPFKLLIRPHSNQLLIRDIAPKLQFVEGDILDIPSLEVAFKGVTQVIHCAAVVSFGEVSKDLMYKINVEGTANVVNLCLKKNISRLCYMSSVAALGRDPKSIKADENSKWINSPLNSEYAISKYLAELEVWRGIEEGLNAIMLCPSIVIGPGDWNKSSTKIFKNIYEGISFFPSGSTNIVDVRDVADAAIIALKSNISAQKYIISGHNLSYEHFFKSIAAGFAKPLPSIKLTKNMILPVYYILKWLIPFYLKKRFINRETILISNSHFEYQNKKFIDEFKFSYRNAEESIQWCCSELVKMNKTNSIH
jgi:nucleoside-diphosphate-sugar epimerase